MELEIRNPELNEEETQIIFADKRRVRFCADLEEVRYFTPLPPESRWIKRIRYFKDRAGNMKQNVPVFLLASVMLDKSALRRFTNGVGFLIRKINHRAEKVNIEDICNLNRQWDELFELHKTRETRRSHYLDRKGNEPWDSTHAARVDYVTCGTGNCTLIKQNRSGTLTEKPFFSSASTQFARI